MMKKRVVKKATTSAIAFFLQYRQLPPGILELIIGLSRRPEDLMQFNFLVAERCPEMLQAIFLLERAGIDSIYGSIPIGRDHHPGTKKPVESGTSDGVRDREYQ